MKNLILNLVRNLLKVFYVFPIKGNRVFFSAYSGKQYSCNPKYITETLLKSGEGYEIIWAFCEPEKFALDARIRKVKFKSLSFLYYLLTSHVVVDNVESWSILPKRKGQTVINTWHGGGAYKGVGLKRNDAMESLNQNMLQKNKRITLYISSSKCFTQMTLRDSFRYQGEVLECGMPRNDLLMQQDAQLKHTIREQLGIGEDVHIVLFAPTFRKDMNFQYELDPDAVITSLEKRFSGKWMMLFRAHYYLTSEFHNVKNVSSYPDMQELLLAADVLITDYSSSMWDFSLMYKPCFLFVPDLSSYHDEREFYTPITSWPYPYAETMDGLTENIMNFDPESYKAAVVEHHSKLGNCESGHASEMCSSVIRKICFEE